MAIDKKDLIDYVYGFKFTYKDYQMENFVIDTGITDAFRARQCVIEIENRYKLWEDSNFSLREQEINLKIAQRNRDNEKDELQKELYQIEVEKLEAAVIRTRARVKGLDDEINLLKSHLDKYAETIEDLDKILQDPKNERDYWVSRIGKQSAIDMLSYGKISSGNMDSITNMPSDDQEQVIAGAIKYTKKMEHGILALQDNVMKQLGNETPNRLLPDVNEEIDPAHEPKNLLGTSKPKTGL